MSTYLLALPYDTYAAILALPVTFLFPLAFGSTFTFKLSAVDDVVWNSSEGPKGAEEAALVVRDEAPVEKAVALSMMATISKTATMSLFMVTLDLSTFDEIMAGWSCFDILISMVHCV